MLGDFNAVWDSTMDRPHESSTSVFPSKFYHFIDMFNLKDIWRKASGLWTILLGTILLFKDTTILTQE